MTREEVVAVIQPFVPTYRVGLFDAIARQLLPHRLRLEVWNDQPSGIVAARVRPDRVERPVPAATDSTTPGNNKRATSRIGWRRWCQERGF